MTREGKKLTIILTGALVVLSVYLIWMAVGSGAISRRLSAEVEDETHYFLDSHLSGQVRQDFVDECKRFNSHGWAIARIEAIQKTASTYLAKPIYDRIIEINSFPGALIGFRQSPDGIYTNGTRIRIDMAGITSPSFLAAEHIRENALIFKGETFSSVKITLVKTDIEK